MDKPKSINALMAYMRNEKHIDIHGSDQKLKLRYMGYFHGYKGYRYCSNPSKQLAYSNFTELQAVYDFDMKLKALMYEKLLFLETAIKNFALEEVIARSGSEDFNTIFSTQMTFFKTFPYGGERYRTEMSRRLKIRTTIYGLIARDYEKAIVKHYNDQNRPLPIWAIFELMSLGDFGLFLQCLDPSRKRILSLKLGINSAFDGDGDMPRQIVYTLKDLRNAIAHNGVVFDTRFRTFEISKRVSKCIEHDTKISNVKFDTITDYIILIAFCLKNLKYSKKEILSFIRQFEDACNQLNKQIPFSLFSLILDTNWRNEIAKLKAYV